MKVYVDFWAKDESGTAHAGGFLRCDSLRELLEFAVQCRKLDLAYRVTFSENNPTI